MRRCYGILYLRDDGSDAARIDYYTLKDTAWAALNKMNRIHGPHRNGNPRWRMVCFVATVGDV